MLGNSPFPQSHSPLMNISLAQPSKKSNNQENAKKKVIYKNPNK